MNIKTTTALYILNTHPYRENITDLSISGNPEYTAPILNYFEEKKGKYDTETGESFGNQLNCVYFDSKQGKFVKRLLNRNLINSLTFELTNNSLLSEIEFQNDLKLKSIKELETTIKNKFLYKRVSLRSMPLELAKLKLNRSSTNERLIETNHLDFLPPIMQIIGYKFTDEKKKFCEESGDLKLEFKCKWFNHSSKSFSEEFLPYQTLIVINELTQENNITRVNDFINSNVLFQHPINKLITLEGTDIKINYNFHIPEKIIFNHYYHEIKSFDLINQKEFRISDFSKIKKISDNEFWGLTYPSYHNNKRLKINDCDFKPNNYYYINYKDQYKYDTKRIIKVVEILFYVDNISDFKKNESYKNEHIVLNDNNSLTINFGKIEDVGTLIKSLKDDPNISVLIKANCLLRNGLLRHFRLDGVQGVREIRQFEKEDNETTSLINLFENSYEETS